MVHFTTHNSEFYADFLYVACGNRGFSANAKYGMDIRLATKDCSRCVLGTCGGLLQLETPSHAPRQVGLVAGHLLEQLTHTSYEAAQTNCEAPSFTGDILYPRSSREMPRHDWALFDAADFTFKYPISNQPVLTIAQKSEFPKEDTVVSIRTSKGEVTGILSSSTSGIMLNPDQGFLYVRMIIMSKGLSLPISSAFPQRKPQENLSVQHKYLYWNRLGYHKWRLGCMGS